MDRELWLIYREAYKHGNIPQENIDMIYKLYKSAGREKIEEAVKKKKLVAAVAKLFVDIGIDEQYWKQQVDYYKKRNLMVVDALNDMHSLLDKYGANHLAVVENFGALLSSKQDICMFNSGDVDQYGDFAVKENIYSILKEAGYEISENYAGKILISSCIRHKTRIPDNFYFGINWDLTTRKNLPAITSKDDVVDWTKCTKYLDTHIQLPAIEALMYICLMHIAVHGFCKAPDIRLYYDIVNILENDIDWNTIIKWSIRDRNEVRLATASILAGQLLGADIPEEVKLMGRCEQVQKLLRTVYDEKSISLKESPNAYQRCLIEAYSCDAGVQQGFKSIILPDGKWIEERYGSLVLGRVQHFLSIF